LVEEAVEFETLKAFLDDQLDMETLRWEQRGNQWSGENETEFKAAVSEDQRMLADIRTRIDAWLK